MEIRVFGDDDVAVLAGVVPYRDHRRENFLGKRRTTGGPDAGRGCGRRAASKRGLCHEPALDVSGEGQAGANVFRLQKGEVGQDLLLRHTRGKIAQNVIDGNPHSPDARLSAPHVGIYGDALPVIHVRSLRRERNQFKNQTRLLYVLRVTLARDRDQG
jgi:hypothetical protein